MSYAERFSQTHKLTFKDQAQLAADHHESKLRPFVSEQTCEGERSAEALFYDSGKAQRREGRIPKNRDFNPHMGALNAAASTLTKFWEIAASAIAPPIEWATDT